MIPFIECQADNRSDRGAQENGLVDAGSAIPRAGVGVGVFAGIHEAGRCDPNSRTGSFEDSGDAGETGF